MNTENKGKIETFNTSQIETSSRRRRFFAYMIDSVILSLCIQILLALYSLFPINPSYKESLLFSVSSIVVSFAYFAIFPISSWWGTPGQKLMKIYICRNKNVSKISLPFSILRVMVFNFLWIVSFAISALLLIGSDIKDLKNLLHSKSMQYKKSMHFEGNMFYKDNPAFISFHDKKNNKTIHLLNTMGKSNIIIENSNHQLTLSHDGKQLSEQFYDHKISFHKEIKKSYTAQPQTKQKHTTQTAEAVFFLLTKLMSYSVVIFLALLIFPTMLNKRKQTIYDIICRVFVAKEQK